MHSNLTPGINKIPLSVNHHLSYCVLETDQKRSILPDAYNYFVVVPVFNPSTNCTPFCGPFSKNRIIWPCKDTNISISIHYYKNINYNAEKERLINAYHLRLQGSSVSSFLVIIVSLGLLDKAQSVILFQKSLL